MGLNRNVILKKDDCYLWDAYTHPNARGKHYHKYLTIYRERVAFKYGKKRSLSIVASFNRASKNSYLARSYNLQETFITYNIFKKGFKSTLKYGK